MMLAMVQRRREARRLAESGGRGREVMPLQRSQERVDLGGEPRRRLGAEMPGLAVALMLKLNIRRTRENGWLPAAAGTAAGKPAIAHTLSVPRRLRDHS